MQTISSKQARNIILQSQGLAENTFGNKKQGTLRAIEHLGYVQIDTISVVERAHHHTLWSRNSDYQKNHLDTLLEKDKTIFEYWSHAAAYLPMRDYRFSLIRKERFAKAKTKWYGNKKVLKFVYDRVLAEGPLQSKDFEEKKKTAGWWEWKETKRALEQLFMEGRLMVAGRKGFQKVYDLTERVLPNNINTSTPTATEYANYLIEKTLQANGLVAREEIGYLRPFAKSAVEKLLHQKSENKELLKVQVEGVDDTFYITPQTLNEGAVRTKKVIKILSPFDNLVIQRKRLKRIFDFDYTIECYVSEAKRKYGYFCLPALYGDTFIGRIDCKADRVEKTLYVKNAFYEPKFEKDAKAKAAVKKELQKFAAFNGCDKIV